MNYRKLNRRRPKCHNITHTNANPHYQQHRCRYIPCSMPVAIAEQIGADNWTSTSLPGSSILTVGLPSGTTQYGVAFLCTRTASGSPVNSEWIIEPDLRMAVPTASNCAILTLRFHRLRGISPGALTPLLFLAQTRLIFSSTTRVTYSKTQLLRSI